MTGDIPETGWFENLDQGNFDAARKAIETGTAEQPRDWPALAIESGFAEDEDDYYDALHEATIHATRQAVQEREQAGDQQLIHGVRAMDDCERIANELAERVTEWGASRDADADAGVEYARELAGRAPGGRPKGARRTDEQDGTPREPTDTAEERLVSLAARVRDLADEGEALRAHVERTAPAVAPNLAALAEPVLAARLISLAGGLESLAKMSSGTVQVLGAEEALFAHLRGHASSPKHGVIYLHDAVRNTAPEHRGSAARALAGKLTIAARVDHYSGERKPELDRELDERIARIREREVDGD